jgi:hypothetical protein
MRVPWLLTLGVAFAVGSFGQRLTLKERDMILGSLPLWTGEKSYTGRPSAYRIPNDDSFVFVYRGLDGKGQALTVVPFRLMDRSDPVVAVEIGLQPNNGGFVYTYTIDNGPTAPEPIWGWNIVDPADDIQADVDESVWKGFRAAGAGLGPGASQIFPGPPPGVFFAWADFENPLAPGQSRGSFRVESNFLPGLTTAFFESGKFFGFPDEPPGELEDDITKLSPREVREQLRLTIGPRYAPAVSSGKWAESVARDLRAAYDVMPAFRQSVYIQRALQLLDTCAVGLNCVLSGNITELPGTPVEKDIQRAIEAASTWFSRRK